MDRKRGSPLDLNNGMRPFVETFDWEEEDYVESFSFEDFERITSYAGKVKYAASHLQRLGSGSARVIFSVDDTKVLKVAKNIKGLAQNNIESDYTLQKWCPIVAKVFKIGEEVKDVGPFYLEMELAKKVSPARFEALTGVSLKDLQDYLAHKKSLINRGKIWISIDPEVEARLNDNEFVGHLMDLIANYDMSYPGDFGRINSYGEVLREGEPTVVLVDFGLTSSVWLDYYARN